jgi:hypothetical protein
MFRNNMKEERKGLPWPIESIVALESQDATFKTADWLVALARMSVH